MFCFTQDVLYHLNLCGPMNPAYYYNCPTGNVGACQTSLNLQTAYSLGYITSDPIINEDGTITVIYTGNIYIYILYIFLKQLIKFPL